MRVFMYAGQGSQYPGMGKDIGEAYPAFRRTVEMACASLTAAAAAGSLLPEGVLPEENFGERLLSLMYNGPADRLGMTEYTQPCMAMFAAGVTQVLLENGILPDAACGLSLGEYGALYAAGVWNTDTYVGLTVFRGRVMADAVRGRSYVMSAVLGVSDDAAAEVCREITAGQGMPQAAGSGDAEPYRPADAAQRLAVPVNYNCPGQIVICGDADSVAAAENEFSELFGARCVRLNTTSPFHTKLLRPAGDALRKKFGAVSFGKPRIPSAMNVTGRLLLSGEDLRELLCRQVQEPVRFGEDIAALIRAGADEFIEIGPGNVLSGLCRKTARSLKQKVRVSTVQNAEDLARILSEGGAS